MRIQGSGLRVRPVAGTGRTYRSSFGSVAEYFILRALYSVLAVVVLTGCTPAVNAQPKGGAAQSSGALEVVLAGKPARKTLTLTTTQPARIETLEQTPIFSKVAAYVGEVLVDFGDQVKKEQPLVRLAAPELEAELAQKKALLEQSKALAALAEAGAKAAEAAVMTAQARVAQAEAATDRANTDITRWRSEFARIGQLAASGAVNRQLVDETQQKLGAAEASLKETAAAIEAARAAH